jgi:hypothetical protein
VIYVGTERGLQVLPDHGEKLLERPIRALAATPGRLWAALDDGQVWRREETWAPMADIERLRPTSLLPLDGTVLVGTSEARLFRDDQRVGPFDNMDGRDEWYTPWGGPPDTRSMSRGPDGVLYVNVHVGGIPRSTDGGESWEPTIDIDTDVHQVFAHPEQPGRVLAACALGFAESRDGGVSWTITDEGLHASYSRAVAVAGDTILLSASTSHRGERAAVYRRPLDADGPFERCSNGLPEWFQGNIDTHWLEANDGRAAFASPDGHVYTSEDAGSTWEEAAAGLVGVRCLALG